MAYDLKNDPNNANAIPLYNDNILKFWNWFDSVWGCNDWMTWHKSMVKSFGKTKADNRFMQYWDDLATGSSAIDCRTFNSSFRTYMRSVGLLDALYSGLGVIAQPIGGVIELGTGIGSGIGSLGGGIKAAGNVLKVVIPLLVIVAVVFIIIYANKKVKQ